jgi:hypothetical protein
MGTRPDIAFSVSSVSRHTVNSTEQHLKALFGILQYLKTTVNYVLTNSGNENNSEATRALRTQTICRAEGQHKDTRTILAAEH